VRFHLVHIDDHVVQWTQEPIEADELKGGARQTIGKRAWLITPFS